MSSTMKTLGVVAIVSVGVCALQRRRQARKPRYLQVVQEIPLSLSVDPKDTDVVRCAAGRVDHMCFDKKRKFLFIACLGEDKVLVVDVFAGRVVRILSDGLQRPQGVLYVERTKRLYVANATDGFVIVFDCSTDFGDWKRIASVDFGDEADNLRYADGYVWVGYGDGALGPILDGKEVSDIRREQARDCTCAEHPESFQLETSGNRAFVNVADEKLVQVIDRISGQTLEKWLLPPGLGSNFPMCLDEENRRLIVGVRQPLDQACLVMYDIDSGAVLKRVPCVGDADDLFLDAKRRRLYVIGGVGSVSVVDADTFDVLGEVDTAMGARTGFMLPARNSLVVACPGTATTPSRLLVMMARD